MELNTYSIQELENIDFRSSIGKKIKKNMGISLKEIKKKIEQIIQEKKNLQNNSSEYQKMLTILPTEKINITQSFFLNPNNKNTDVNIQNTENEINQNIQNIENEINQNNKNIEINIQTTEKEINSTNYIVQLFNQGENIQLKLNKEEFIKFAINNGYTQEFILDFLNRENKENKENTCKINEFQWLNEDFYNQLKMTIKKTPFFFKNELSLIDEKHKIDLYNQMYDNILEIIEENKRRNVQELQEINEELLKTLLNQYSTINTIEKRLTDRFEQYRNRDILQEYDLFREKDFYKMKKELEKISDLRIREFMINYRYDYIHNKQRNVIDTIVRILIPPRNTEKEISYS